jgi:undecaprenyldiphospho-muramoylpentapeptide beta-N-acetylglucosaminyltransferase
MGRRAWAVIAGGGTAGHVTPAIAVAEALVARGHDRSSIHFVGAARGVEARLVPAAGFSVTLLPGRGIQRRPTPANLVAVAGIVAGVVRALRLVRRLRPAVVVSVGGYASVPCVVAATLWRVPVVLAEQNATPGAANRLAARVARAAAVAFPQTPLPRAVVTGNPVRPGILAVDRSDAGRAAARAALGLPEGRRVLLVFGGSLGARRLNDAVLGAVAGWAGRGDLAVHHVTGPRDHDRVVAAAPTLPPGGLVWRPVPFEARMDLAYAAADLAVCRAGASTVAELTVVGLPAVLVPYPAATGDHQTHNARAVAAAGGAIVLADAECTGSRLAAEVEALLADPGRLAAMEAAMRRLARPDAAERVADLVEAHARG